MSADASSDLGDGRRNTLRMLAVAAAVLVADQLSKRIASDAVDSDGEIDLVLGFQIVDVSNRGIAFGLFDDGGALVPIVTLVALVALVAWFAFDRRRPWLWLGVGLLAGGALGNLVDRLRDDGVTDFLDPPLWPAFNLADVAITAGVVTLALVALAAESRADEDP